MDLQTLYALHENAVKLLKVANEFEDGAERLSKSQARYKKTHGEINPNISLDIMQFNRSKSRVLRSYKITLNKIKTYE